MTDRIRVPTPSGVRPLQTREELLAYYEEWPRLQCSDKACRLKNYGNKMFIGTRSESGTHCPQCKQGILSPVPPESFDPDLEEEGI